MNIINSIGMGISAFSIALLLMMILSYLFIKNNFNNQSEYDLVKASKAMTTFSLVISLLFGISAFLITL